MNRRLAASLIVCSFAFLAAPVVAQCGGWQAGFEYPGSQLDPFAWATFDDGSGPALYVGGSNAESTNTARGVERWDGTRWSPVGGGIEGNVFALAAYDDGSGPALYAAGIFTIAGGVAVHNIARWNGTSWSDVGGGVSGATPLGSAVNALRVFDDGSGPELYAGGVFTMAGAQNIRYLARWNGSAWSAVDANFIGTVRALEVFDDGSGSKLWVGGSNFSVGASFFNGVVRWNTSGWSQPGTGVKQNGFAGSVYAFAAHDDGSGAAMFVGGVFDTAGAVAANYVAKWNGSVWSALGTGTSGPTMGGAVPVRALASFNDGTGTALFAGGQLTSAGGVTANGLAEWRAGVWSVPGQGLDTFSFVNALCVHDDGHGSKLYAGGNVSVDLGASGFHTTRFDGNQLRAVGGGAGMLGRMNALGVVDLGNGPELYAGGYFLAGGLTPVGRVARFSGSSWVALGSGMTGTFGVPRVNALCAYDDGTGVALYAGGDFSSAGGVPASHIARWDGSNWTPVGSGVDLAVNALCVHDDGTGAALYATGSFVNAGGTQVKAIARWDGTTWTALGSGLDSAGYCLADFDDGTGSALYVGGAFLNAGGNFVRYIARWKNGAWSSLAGGVQGGLPIVLALLVHDDGSGPGLYATGRFTLAGATNASAIARWNGTSWSALGAGLSASGPTSVQGGALGSFDDGSGSALYAGGAFTLAGGVAVSNFARWQGGSWSDVHGGVDGQVWTMCTFDDGIGQQPDLYVGGSFVLAGEVSSSRIARLLHPELCATAFCPGDGGVTRPCPCANSGAPGHGCGSSVNASGALLGASGTSNPDTVVLASSEMPDTAACIYLQGDTLRSDGVVFGDGVRCASGMLLRLGLKQSVGGASQLPAPGDPALSTVGMVSPGSGDVRYYQTYYRNPASFCTSATFNVTNGVRVVW